MTLGLTSSLGPSLTDTDQLRHTQGLTRALIDHILEHLYVKDRDSRFVVANRARAHETAGFDRVLGGYHSTAPDGLAVAAYVAAPTHRLGLLIAHRPAFLAPGVASRDAAVGTSPLDSVSQT